MATPRRPARQRRRAHAGAGALLILLAATLAALVWFRVSVEANGFVEERRRTLSDRLDRLAADLRSDMRRAIDALEPPLSAPRASNHQRREAVNQVVMTHPIVEAPFQVQGETILWPPVSASRGSPPGLLDSAFDGPPRQRRLVSRIFEKIAGDDVPGALEAVSLALDARSLTAVARAELEFLRARLLEKRLAAEAIQDAGSRGTPPSEDIIAGMERVIALAGSGDTMQPRLASLVVAARLRRAQLLAESSVEAGRGELAALLDDVVAAARQGQDWARNSLAIVLERADDLPPGALQTARELSERLDAERRLVREIEAVWLPAMRGEQRKDERNLRVVVRHIDSQPAVVAWRREATTNKLRVTGFRASSEWLRERILAVAELFDAVQPVQLVPASDSRLAAHSRPPGVLELGIGHIILPWHVRADIRPSLAEYRRGRLMLWSGVAVALLVVVGAMTFARLQYLDRQIELAEARSQFVANVSHELKTPLTLIRMSADLVRLGYAQDRKEAERNLEVIARESDSLSLLIENVLDLSRIDSGELALRPSPVDLGALTVKVLEELRPIHEARGFAVRREIDLDLPLVDVDELAFSRVLQNLISNAVKYSRECDDKEIEVALGRDEMTRSEVVLTVSDRGSGLPPGDPRRLFERFVRGAEQSGVSGTGIGLAIVKHIVEAHGGSVEARPREGGGSRFAARFPLEPSTGRSPGRADRGA